jgi:hypothetical protein
MLRPDVTAAVVLGSVHIREEERHVVRVRTAGSGTVQGIGSAMSAQNAAAAVPTTDVVPAAADEVSALTAAQSATHAQMYQAVSVQAAAIGSYCGHRVRQRDRGRLIFRGL